MSIILAGPRLIDLHQGGLTVPLGASGTVRVFGIDPDDFEGGRKQAVSVAGESLGTIEKFTDGRWLEQRVTPAQTATGKILVRAANARKGSNAVISIVEGASE